MKEKSVIPSRLTEFVHDKHMRASLPIQFSFEHVPWILDIMCFLDLADPVNFDTELNRIRFARNGEGFVLLVDLNTDALEIMQEEFDDIDHLGISLDDLRVAEWSSC